jgi:ribose/xylose/arabinose/galactoside ABC-type transport system permease subunit
VVLLATAGVFAVISPIFLSPGNLVSIVHQVTITGIMAIGMTLVVMTGGIDLSIGPVLAFVGVVAADILIGTGGNVFFAIVGGLAVSILIGLVNGILIAIVDLQPLVVTLAGLSIVRGIALLVGGPDLHLIRGPDLFLAIGSGLLGGVPFSVFLFLATIFVGAILQYRTKFGLCILAVGDNEHAAKLSGHATRQVKMFAYVVCSFTAGIAGIIQASQVHTAAATYGTGIELDVIAAVVLGGTNLAGGSGSVFRTVYGILMIGIMNNGMALLNVPIEMQLIAKGVIIAAALTLAGRQR